MVVWAIVSAATELQIAVWAIIIAAARAANTPPGAADGGLGYPNQKMQRWLRFTYSSSLITTHHYNSPTSGLMSYQQFPVLICYISFFKLIYNNSSTITIRPSQLIGTGCASLPKYHGQIFFAV